MVKSFPPDKAPGPDGFTTLFFQKCWDVLGWELLLALEVSRKTGSMLKEFNATNVVIIPKIGDPQSFSDFRPISLCNTIYKIFTKAIYFNLKSFYQILFHQNRGDLCPEETSEGAIVAHETLHFIKDH